jgi:hypothetical protein
VIPGRVIKTGVNLSNATREYGTGLVRFVAHRDDAVKAIPATDSTDFDRSIEISLPASVMTRTAHESSRPGLMHAE